MVRMLRSSTLVALLIVQLCVFAVAEGSQINSRDALSQARTADDPNKDKHEDPSKHPDEPSTKPDDHASSSGSGQGGASAPETTSAAEMQQWRRDHIVRHDKSAPLDVESSEWWWASPVVAATFLIFFLSTNRLKCLGGISFRQLLVRYFSAEPLHPTTMRGSGHHVLVEQRDAEYGQQFLTLCGCVMLIVDWAVNENRDDRYAVTALTAVQMCLMLCCTAADVALLKAGFVRPVRTINTKLRFAHCTYQVVLFCTDSLSSSFNFALPVDCFIWATVHYSYEAISLAVEGLNVIGMSEFVIIVLVNFKLLTATEAATGWRIAFALTSLALSSLSLIVGLAWKLTHLQHEDRLTDDHGEEHEDGKEGHHDDASATTANRRVAAAASTTSNTHHNRTPHQRPRQASQNEAPLLDEAHSETSMRTRTPRQQDSHGPQDVASVEPTPTPGPSESTNTTRRASEEEEERRE